MDSERAELEPHLAAAMDKLMEDLWMSGSDDFTPLINLMMAEKISGKIYCIKFFLLDFFPSTLLL